MSKMNETYPIGHEPASGQQMHRASSNEPGIFMLPRQKSRSRDRRESRMFLVDGQLFWSDDTMGLIGGKRHSSAASFAIGSSMDLSGIGQSLDSSGGGGTGSEELISYRIKWCRESIAQLKRQTWPMERKLQTLKACKMFIKQHQGELKQSKQARDVLTSTSAVFERYWRHFKREFANFLVIITPWEMRIKKIESHFGSVVASYFTFLRWIFWLNLANSLVLCSFVLVPELIENSPDVTGMRKGDLGMVPRIKADGQPDRPEFNPTLGEIWEFEGFLKFSPIFYGYYNNIEISRSGFWRNPLAYLLSIMLTYLFCFFCISRKLSQNNKLSRAGTKDDEYTFCWTVFVGWDFMIGNSETAYNKTSSLIMNLKEGILEEKEQTKDRDWRLLLRRILANLISIVLIVSSAYVVFVAVQRSENLPEDATLLQKNELQLVMSGIQFIFPPLFDAIGFMEGYHPRKALNWQLGRILSLDFLNFYTLMFSLFGTVGQMGVQLNEVSGNITLLRQNQTYYRNLFTTTTTTTSTTTTTTTTLAPSSTLLSSNGTNSTTLSSILDMNATTITMQPTELMNVTSNSSDAMGITQVYSTENSSSPDSRTESVTIQVIYTTPIEVPTSTTSNYDPSLAITVSEATSNSIEQAVSTRQPSSTPTNGDDDYPDLNELILANKKPPDKLQPKKRSPNLQTKSLNEDGMHSSRVFNGAFIPPIRDPYTKAINKWEPTPKHKYEFEGEDDEPLEGRMGQEMEKGTRNPPLPSPGIARPIGGQRHSSGRRNRPTQVSKADEGSEYEDESQTDSVTESGVSPRPIPTDITSDPPMTSTVSSETSPIAPTSSDFPQIKEQSFQLDEKKSDGEQPSMLNGSVNLQSLDTKRDKPNENSSYNISINGMKSSIELMNITTKNIRKGKVEENCQSDCDNIPTFHNEEILALNETQRDKLKSLCWETMFGQEMVKIVVMDLVMNVFSVIGFEFMRACFVRYCNRFFFWDLERGIPGYQDFKIAENVLHLVNNQSTVWMGMFFAPGLPALNTIKLAVMMYVRSWAVLTCNIPHETVFKVSKSNNFYYLILLLNLIISIMPVAYAVTWIRPSWHCGPFGGECRMYVILTKQIKSMLPPEVNAILKYLTSPGTVIPMIIILILIIYYLSSTLSSNKEANKELRAQLKKDKEQEGAVPEITSTSVVDTTNHAPTGIQPQPQPQLQSQSQGLAPTSQPSGLDPTTLVSPNLNSVVTTQPSSKSGPGLMPDANQTSSRPKSLLLPPPNPM